MTMIEAQHGNKGMDKIDEQPFERMIATEVKEVDDGYWVEMGRRTFFLSKVHNIEPRVGDTIYFYGDGIGSLIRGVAINGVVAFHRTPEEHAEEGRRLAAEIRERRTREFEAARGDHDRRIAALPEVFRKRLAYFGRNPEWRVSHESYELMCCEQAVLFASTLGSIEALEEFVKLDFEQQVERVPGLDQGHSGNSLGASIMLARFYLTNPDLVPDVHGALVYLVGCDEYGCEHPRPWREAV